jgi:hypothetical protein
MWLDRKWPSLRLGICVFLFLCVAAFMLTTLRWRLVNDAAQIDYACYLMDHGMAPYKDLVELNMPGIYLVNWSVMHTLGSSGVAWRLFDFSLLAAAALAMFWIARPWGWLGGAFGSALFALYHGRDGPAQTAQRDLIIAVLMLCAFAFLFHALRQRKRWPMFFFGVCMAAAAAIKPFVLPFALLLLAAAALRLRQTKRPMAAALALAVAGMSAALAIVLAFLAAHGSVGAFAWMMEKTLPYYATLGRQSFADLASRLMSPTVRTLVVLALAVAFLRRSWNWESVMLLGGVAFGIVSYFLQGKGFPYHRYPMLAFLFLWCGIQFAVAIRETWSSANSPRFTASKEALARRLAMAGLLLGAAFAPIYCEMAARGVWNEDFNHALAADLTQLGGQRLSGRVQCLSTPGDCDTVLYRMNLVQSTGLVYDYFIFGPGDQPVIERTRDEVWRSFNTNPPQVIVVGRGLYGVRADNRYDKLATWPAFASYLAANYRLYDERAFRPAECGYRGYRIYVRKNPPLPDQAQYLRASLSQP